MSLEDFEAFQKCFLRLSHERWTGRRDMISCEEAVSAIERDPDVSGNDKEKCRDLFENHCA